MKKTEDWSLVDTQKKQREFFEDPAHWRQMISLDLYEGVILEIFDHYGLRIGKISVAMKHPDHFKGVELERSFEMIGYYMQILDLDPLTFDYGQMSKGTVLKQFKDLVDKHKKEEK